MTPPPTLKTKYLIACCLSRTVENFELGGGVGDRGVRSNGRKMVIRGKSNKLIKNAYSNAALSTTKIN